MVGRLPASSLPITGRELCLLGSVGKSEDVVHQKLSGNEMGMDVQK